MQLGQVAPRACSKFIGNASASSSVPERGNRAPLACSVLSAKRMNREDFFAELAPLGEDRLRKVLWNKEDSMMTDHEVNACEAGH